MPPSNTPRKPAGAAIHKAKDAIKAERDTRFFIAGVGLFFLGLVPGHLGLNGPLYAAIEGGLAIAVFLLAIFWGKVAKSIPDLAAKISSFVSGKAWISLFLVTFAVSYVFDLEARSVNLIPFAHGNSAAKPNVPLYNSPIHLRLRITSQGAVAENKYQDEGIYAWNLNAARYLFQPYALGIFQTTPYWLLTIIYADPTSVKNIIITTSLNNVPYKVLVNDSHYTIINLTGELSLGSTLDVDTQP